MSLHYKSIDNDIRKRFSEFQVVRQEGYHASIYTGLPNTFIHPFGLGGIRIAYPQWERYDPELDCQNLAAGMRPKWITAEIAIRLFSEIIKPLHEELFSACHIDGGKMVVLVEKDTYESIHFNPHDSTAAYPDERKLLMKSIGDAINSFEGRYIGAEDAGTCVADMDEIGKHTQYLACKSDADGNPSPSTARALFHGLRKIAMLRGHEQSLEGVVVGIYGVGNVGEPLVRYLSTDTKATLLVYDINEEKVARLKNELKRMNSTSNFEDILLNADIIVPCAKGDFLGQEHIEKMKSKVIVVGAANNFWQGKPSDALSCATMLHARGGYTVPHYSTNLGGVLNVAMMPHFLKEARIHATNEADARSVAETKMNNLTFCCAILQEELFLEHKKTGLLPDEIMELAVMTQVEAILWNKR